ncbi:peptidoglycan-binding protein [uncultured Bradyrhizobium sp.]|uniref:peptidoglycan-binding protein n=1 Tax=uncultured Bradyrhizobium sp. TaxID=199684 RepID=UPI0035CA6330
MTDLNALQRANDTRWNSARLTGRLSFDPVARKALANKARYLDVVRRCRARGSNMPDEAWVFVAVIHNRESGMDFSTHLGQGDPLSRPTTHVPAGRGPFFGVDAFERGAVDALMDCAPKAAIANRDWSISGMLTYVERFNGLAYANARPPRPSPYLWSGTTVYDPPSGPGGKVLVDHGPIENVTDKQLGVAGLLLKLDALDDTISFAGLPEVLAQPALPQPNLAPVQGVDDAVWLQTSLNKLGATPQLVVDGIAGAGTRTAVVAFQTSKGLAADGVAGPATIAAIKAALTGPAALSKPPDVTLPPPGPVRTTGLAPTFWGRVKDLFKPKAA